jgi:gluconate kinase
MSDRIGNTEALEGYLKLEQENKRLLSDNQNLRHELQSYHKHYGDVSRGVDILFNWLESRRDTKTKTIQRRMAEIFKFAYMEAQFEDLRSKWKNQESVEWARKEYPSTDSLTKTGDKE